MRVSLEKWTNREITSKTDADIAFGELKNAVRAGTFDKRGAAAELTMLTFRQFAQIYKERHVFAKALAIGKTIDYRLRPIIDHLGDGRWRKYERQMSRTSSRICGSRRSQVDGRTLVRSRQRRSIARWNFCGT